MKLDYATGSCQRSLFRRVMAFFSLSAAILVLISLVLTTLYIRYLSQDLSRRDLALARSISREIRSTLDHCKEEILQLSGNIAPLSVEDPSVKAAMTQVLDSHPSMKRLWLIDPDGLPVRTMPDGTDLSTPVLPGRTAATPALGRKDALWSLPQVFAETGTDMVTLSTPVRDFILAAQLDLQHLIEMILSSGKPTEKVRIALTTGSPTIVEYSRVGKLLTTLTAKEREILKQALDGETRSFEGSLDGAIGLLSASPVMEGGWGVLVFRPYTGTLHLAETLRNTGFMILSGALLSAFLISVVFMKKVLGQFQYVIDQTVRVSKGEYNVSIKPRYRELEKLAEGFNTMARSIEAREQDLKSSEARYRTLFQSIPIPVFLFDIESTRILDVNKAAISDYGYSLEEFLDMTVSDIRPSENIGEAVSIFRSLSPASGQNIGSWRHRRKDGTIFYVDITVHDLLYNGGKARMAICKDITEQVQAEKILQDNQERLRATLESIGDSIVIVDRGMNIIWSNRRAVKVFGFREGDKCHRVLHGRDDACDKCMLSSAINQECVVQNEGLLDTSEGEQRTFLITSAPMYDPSGTVSGVVKSFKDIHDLKESERLVRKSLAEKETLLKEFHHRVKNNLQAVSGLLSMQSRFSDDLWTRKVLRDSQNRILSMAIIHEKLYRMGDLKRIDMGDYLNALVGRLVPIYGAGDRGLRTEVRCDGVFLNLDTAHPIGLIVTELVSNSCQHAFPQGQGGRISLELKENGSSEFILTCGDDGVGLPGDGQKHRGVTLGLNLVKSYVEGLGGTMGTKDGKGTRYIITFPEYHECPVEEL